MRSLTCPLLLSVLLLPAAASATTTVSVDRCKFESDFDLRLRGDAIELQREHGAPQQIRLSGGQLWIDGAQQSLSAGDQRRVEQIEQQVRSLIPEIKAIALDGVEIGIAAVSQVAVMLGGSESEAVVAQVRSLKDRLNTQIDADLARGEFDEAAFEAEIEALAESLAPKIAGEVAALAVRAALSGDEAAVRDIEQRAKSMEEALEQEMKQRSTALEARAEALCPRIEAINQLEDALELRLADGSRLDLLQR